MPNPVGTIIKLVIASLIVGAIMMWLDVDALGLLRWVGDVIHRIWGSLGDFARWIVTPLLLGATVVIPIWLIAFLIGKAKKR